MDEKQYPHIEEEQNTDMCCEPAAEAVGTVPTSVNGVTKVHDWIDDLDWDRFPSYGPFSEEEAIARIEKAERDLKDPSKWTSSEEFTKQLYEEFPWLRQNGTKMPKSYSGITSKMLTYFYDEVEDTVHIMDIWDTKANPKALIKRIK